MTLYCSILLLPIFGSGLQSRVGMRMVNRLDVLKSHLGQECMEEPECDFNSRYALQGPCSCLM